MRTAARGRFFRSYLQFYKIVVKTIRKRRRCRAPQAKKPRSYEKRGAKSLSNMRSNGHTKPVEILQNKRVTADVPPSPDSIQESHTTCRPQSFVYY